MTWTKAEMLKLNEYEYLRNEFCQIPIDIIEEYSEDIIQMLFLEAELLIINQALVGYLMH